MRTETANLAELLLLDQAAEIVREIFQRPCRVLIGNHLETVLAEQLENGADFIQNDCDLVLVHGNRKKLWN